MDSHFLEVSGAEFRYGARKVLDCVSMVVKPGEIYVLLGPNAAGKSSLVRAITGRVDLNAGTVRVAGQDPVRSAAARRAIGLVPQQIALYEKLTAQENLSVIGRLMGVKGDKLGARMSDALQQIELADRRSDRVEVLSGGMRRRVNIAAALLHEPGLLILDEPTVGVDQAGRRALRDLLLRLRDSGLAILLTTHEMEEAEALAGRAGVLIGGKLVAEGSVDQLVHLHFGRQMELAVKFAADSGGGDAGSEVRPAMAGAGLAFDASTGQWQGLVEPDKPAVRELLGRLTAGGIAASDVRLRRPGLDTLMRHLVVPPGDEAQPQREAAQ
jgi:ABC-2 type transport system ATP-binding protein